MVKGGTGAGGDGRREQSAENGVEIYGRVDIDGDWGVDMGGEAAKPCVVCQWHGAGATREGWKSCLDTLRMQRSAEYYAGEQRKAWEVRAGVPGLRNNNISSTSF